MNSPALHFSTQLPYSALSTDILGKAKDLSSVGHSISIWLRSENQVQTYLERERRASDSGVVWCGQSEIKNMQV